MRYISGGDQSLYVEYWANTEVQTIIQSKLVNVTVGGTSAGLAVLGNWIYTGEDGSATSEDALKVLTNYCDCQAMHV
jgi:cyanophycinase